MSFFNSQSFALGFCYLGDIPPKLCNKHLANYPTTQAKYSELSSYLHMIPFLKTKSWPDCTECPSCHQMVMTCDLRPLWNFYFCPFCKDFVNKEQWIFCTGPCVNSGYFQNCNQLYFHFFEHFFQYCSENPECQCFWPENEGMAAGINQEASHIAGYLEGHNLLFSDFSPYWDKNFPYKGKSLATYSFFYSQHHRICLDLAKYVDCLGANAIYASSGLNEIYRVLERLALKYLKLYSDCLTKHPHPKIYYERGMTHMQIGNSEEALQDIRELIELAKSDKYKDQNIITSEMYQQEGVAYADLGMYDKAIEALNQAILKDPNNLEAYFQRASAYFEIGDFDRSLEDYISSKKFEGFVPNHLSSIEFIDAFSAAAINSTCETACDFLPSLCYTVYGLGKCLWAFGERPVDSIHNLAGAGYDMAEYVVKYLKTVDKETLHEYVDEFLRLHENFNQLSDKEKGKLIGSAIGKYGVDIFAGAAAIKGVSAYKKLKEANRICNLESMALSLSSKESVASKGLQQYAKRGKFFENSKIHWDKQNKHIPGKHNYQEGKSIFEHKDAESLLRKYAGTGTSKRGEIGKPGYQEVVDFKEYIGMWKNKVDSKPTTKGTIHYSKDGVHIVPEHPDVKLR